MIRTLESTDERCVSGRFLLCITNIWETEYSVLTMSEQIISYRARLRSRADLDRFVRSNPDCCSDTCEHIVVTHCTRHGVVSPFYGFIPPSEVRSIGPEPRDHLFARGLNARQRLLLNTTVEFLATAGIPNETAKIYGLEAITPFALALRGRYPKYIGTEYASSDTRRHELFPILHGDICASTFPDAVFDLVLSGDVFEHVPDLDQALYECARILRPGGALLATFPFLFDRDTSVRFARLVDGEIEHLVTPPIYHGDPIDPAGCLVFEIPAWDMIDRAETAGFSDASIEFVCDQARGITASYPGMPQRPRGLLMAKFIR